MKKLIFTLSIIAGAFSAMSQDLAPDQNPNYKVSMDKYASNQLSLQTTNNTTIQETYKAYDFSQAKAERKAERRNFRRESRLFNNYNNNWDNGWNNNYYGNGWNNNRFNNGWNNYNNNRCRFNFYRWIW
jgi:hypothetical protein